MTGYNLECLECKAILPDRGYILSHGDHGALLRTRYMSHLSVGKRRGLWKYACWLPTRKTTSYEGGTVTYKSAGLAREIGLQQLYIGFSGYWPEMDASISTCTFKELEAPPTLQRANEAGVKRIVVASAGNTARAFAYSSASGPVRVICVVPECGSEMLWVPGDVPKNAHLVLLKGHHDYLDAIDFAARISSLPGNAPEGGARNIARRDGMGTVMLDAALVMKAMPTHYFQAVGSGTGGIAAWEAALRLAKDGRFGNRLPRLHLVQNLPFAPMTRAWGRKSRNIDPTRDMPNARATALNIDAKVLSNRNPPYGIKGGVFDALKNTHGRMYGVSNKDAFSASRLFEETEGIDIVPAAAVALAGLLQAVARGTIKGHEKVLLNITGGGEKRAKAELGQTAMKPSITIRDCDMSDSELKRLMGEL